MQSQSYRSATGKGGAATDSIYQGVWCGPDSTNLRSVSCSQLHAKIVLSGNCRDHHLVRRSASSLTVFDPGDSHIDVFVDVVERIGSSSFVGSVQNLSDNQPLHFRRAVFPDPFPMVMPEAERSRSKDGLATCRSLPTQWWRLSPVPLHNKWWMRILCLIHLIAGDYSSSAPSAGSSAASTFESRFMLVA
jgi:hypothetical protein